MPRIPDAAKRLREAAETLTRLKKGEYPSAAVLAAAPKLELWYLTERHGVAALGGVVTGHPTLPEGAHIRTSCLLWLADDQRAARTISRFYRLGAPLGDALGGMN